MNISKHAFLSEGPGELAVINDDGEIIGIIPLKPGLTPGSELAWIAAAGYTFGAREGVTLLAPKGGYGVQPYGEGAHDSGANPLFRPTSVSRLEREMRQTLSRMQGQSKALEARVRSLDKIERIPQAPAPSSGPDGEVIEASPAPATPEPATPAQGRPSEPAVAGE